MKDHQQHSILQKNKDIIRLRPRILHKKIKEKLISNKNKNRHYLY